MAFIERMKYPNHVKYYRKDMDTMVSTMTAALKVTSCHQSMSQA